MKQIKHILPMIGLITLTLLLTGFTNGSQLKPELLPPRPKPPKTAVTGGWISLTISGHDHPMSLWTTVQWQNEHGAWITVDGWRGSPNESATVEWFVGSELLGDDTEFRWNVYDGEDETWLATSDSFTMPEMAQMLTEVSVFLDN